LPKTIKVNIELPEGVSAETKANAEARGAEAIVLALWEAGAISTRVAAEELGLTYYDYLDLLAARGIPVVRGPLDLQAVEEAEQKLAERGR
jgi:hypothetical protein